jgi:putative membrane protein
MKGILLRWLILTGAIIIASYVLDGIGISGFFSAFFAAAMLGILNAFFRPIVIILTLPINILSLGLFTFLINAFMLKIASGVIPGFHVHGFWSAVFGSLFISVVSWFLSSFVNDQGSVEYIDLRYDNTRNRWE